MANSPSLARPDGEDGRTARLARTDGLIVRKPLGGLLTDQGLVGFPNAVRMILAAHQDGLHNHISGGGVSDREIGTSDLVVNYTKIDVPSSLKLPSDSKARLAQHFHSTASTTVQQSYRPDPARPGL